jgi:UDPglucose 6-dehydrogenase
MKVGFIGIGKLGLIAAEVMSDAGNEVVGYDLAPVKSDKVTVVRSIEEAVKDRELIFIAVPTPHNKLYGGEKPCMDLEPKDFDYTIVKSVLAEVNKYVNQSQLVVLISTVLPGTTRSQLRPLITNARFIYNPYLIAMGSVAWDMVNPEMVIIGTDDGDVTHDAKILIDYYSSFMENNPRYEVGTWDEAESIKIFYNTFISTKIGLVNMIQDIAEKSGNINVDVVTNALSRSTHRITGPAYMKAGLGDAGGCHPRDNIALRWLSKKLDLGYDFFLNVMGAREKQAENMAKKLVMLAIDNGIDEIWIHGKAFKPNVSYIDGSYSLLVGHYVEQMGMIPEYVDPLTGDSWDRIRGVILMAHHAPTTYGNTSMYQASSQPFYCNIAAGSIIVDPWRYLRKDEVEKWGCSLIQYGNTRSNQ